MGTININITAAEIASGFNINSVGTNVIIGFSIAAIVVGYASIILLSLGKKEDEFSNFKYYEKLVLSYFIGGLALAFTTILILLTLQPTSQSSHPELTAIIAIFSASMFSPLALGILTKNSETKKLDLKVMVDYFMLALGGILSVAIVIYILPKIPLGILVNMEIILFLILLWYLRGKSNNANTKSSQNKTDK
ncbi:MAG: hypothetical protein ABIF85_04650 [Nanoarchaeota archaeon]|nr:hypothetical protein [Nanoarchaeota archaeon]MBU4301002.1 hypothetical protein [Nanoarchaeota archaeon]MBU4452453.1 hypothetical protein [Nanoarchaeota archaeon]MCG2723983.1 hypothetical protein [archaeon]